MELPRGKFRSIKKGVYLGEILDEMTLSRFSGICSFSSGIINGTLVFKTGTIILANVQNLFGDHAVDEARTLRDQLIDAALSDLDPTQVQLALEFNKQARVQMGGNWHEPSRQKEKSGAVQDEQKKRTFDRQHEPKEKDFIKTVPFSPVVTASSFEVEPTQARETSTDLKEAPDTEAPSPPEPAASTAEKEFDTFDSMDLDDVTQKIRKDCKIILKQLQLDHLTEK
jgi:hypothetical protein